MRLLDPPRDERVVDWFCGLGNVTLVECAQQFSQTAHVESMAVVEPLTFKPSTKVFAASKAGLVLM